MRKESLNWIMLLSMINYQRMHKILLSKIVIKYKKMEEEFVPGSSICLLYVKGKNYLQVWLETQLLH